MPEPVCRSQESGGYEMVVFIGLELSISYEILFCEKSSAR